MKSFLLPQDVSVPMNTVFLIQTFGPALYEFTKDVSLWLPYEANGLLTLFVQHTSASLLIQENVDPEVQGDLDAFFKRLVPSANDLQMSYLRHTYEGPDDMPAHIKAALLPTSLSIPASNGKLCLGRWQGVYLFEHRDARQRRSVYAHLSQ